MVYKSFNNRRGFIPQSDPDMRTIILLAVLGLAVSVPTPGLQFKNLYKPVAGAHKALKPRIIGGTEAVPHSRPYQAFLEFHDSTGFGWYCGGEVVSNNFLLTAGHCGEGGYRATVTLGAHDMKDPSEPTQVIVDSYEITVHPLYDAINITNDISALKLTAPIEFNDNIQPVGLPSRADSANTFVGETATVSGWGLFESGPDGSMSRFLRVLDSPVVPNSQCRADTTWEIPDTQICISGSLSTGTCSGDSGGPLTVKVNGVDTVVGIVSYNVAWCRPGYPSVFTRVTSYLDWIAETTDVIIN